MEQNLVVAVVRLKQNQFSFFCITITNNKYIKYSYSAPCRTDR